MSRRFERWDRSGMPDDAANREIQRGIDAAMRAIVANPHIPTSASMIPDSKRDDGPPPAPRSSETPLTSPPGIRWIDQMVEADSRRQELIAMQQQAELREIERRLDPIEDNVESEYEPFSREHMKR